MKWTKCFIAMLLLSSTAFAQPYLGNEEPEYTPDSKAAGCSPANGSYYLEFNNVKALIHTGGNLWQISGQNFAHYEIPKGSGIHSLFASALWLGGVDINGQLKIAAVRYRNGNDYWAGPLTVSGDAEIIPSTCSKYDRHFVITQDEVREFDAWFNAGLEDAASGGSSQAEKFPDYQIPLSIREWPAHGDPGLDQDFYLAPFYDRDGDGVYIPENGDYPWYDINRELNCTVDRTVTLYGDQTVWWVMNDKGNIHTETGGDPLGMEIRTQAFAFATNDEVNNMTFYNYELINRSTQTLYDTYFGVFIDVALGGPFDDYVGCDVSRGLGYCYNGNAFDADDAGWKGYHDNPPACGVDFFEGPYLDDDGMDNPLIEDYVIAKAEDGIPYPGLGIGYGDGIIDNERLGMRRFLYYNNLGGGGNPSQTDPISGLDYYNYLTGFWKDGTPHVYGGNGHPSDPDANPSQLSQYMFPGDTDPIGWGTDGLAQPLWTEQTAGNPPYDRRFAQSAGPFVLKPGAVNNITTGIAWARSASGDPFESVKSLQAADDKAQALFDNCFKVLDGPHAPEMTIQEMENEIIISLYNPVNSNNQNEDYVEFDPFLVNVDNDPNYDGHYRFQGYQVFQLKDADVSATDLHDIEQARLVFQCDIKDSIERMVNYTFDEDLELSIPNVMVDGANEGISHSFSVKTDQFATGDNKNLVNFKRYHYMAIAYASNFYKEYDPTDPALLDGQKVPYKASRKAAIGEIRSYEAIPHAPDPEGNGTSFLVDYGYELPITKIDGWGNGGLWTDLDAETEQAILDGGVVNELGYVSGAGPIRVKVIDPLNLPNGNFQLFFTPDSLGELDSAGWFIVNLTEGDTVYSDHSIDFANEQLLPEWGISVTLEQTEYELTNKAYKDRLTRPIGSQIIFEDSSKIWLTGIEDNDAFYPTNWIRSGDVTPQPTECIPGALGNPCYYPDKNADFDQEYEELIGGIVGPFKLVGTELRGMPMGYPDANYNADLEPSGWFTPTISQSQASLLDLHGVDVVITSDQSKWTQCPVIEMGYNNSQTVGGSSICKLRYSPSVDKNGVATTGTGMGWFPGYAIDVETGERLNMAFGENSWLHGSNGSDMIWNPTTEFVDPLGEPIFGGMHYIYVFGTDIANGDMPAYDNGQWLHTELSDETAGAYIGAWKNCMWIIEPLLERNATFMETDVRIKLRVSHPYQEEVFTNENLGLPAYEFSTFGIASQTSVDSVAVDALSRIKIVPNPYYGYSSYETGRLDNRVKFTNLPEVCTITIFNMSGGLVKRIAKDNPTTFEDWTMKNHVGIPISGGVYIVHIEVPNVGEKVLKFFATHRTTDTSNL